MEKIVNILQSQGSYSFNFREQCYVSTYDKRTKAKTFDIKPTHISKRKNQTDGKPFDKMNARIFESSLTTEKIQK